jgi:hypothetical protein
MVVTEEKVSAAMEVIAARSRDDVQRAGSAYTLDMLSSPE